MGTISPDRERHVHEVTLDHQHATEYKASKTLKVGTWYVSTMSIHTNVENTFGFQFGFREAISFKIQFSFFFGSQTQPW